MRKTMVMILALMVGMTACGATEPVKPAEESVNETVETSAEITEDPASGDTYVTEFVSGITPEEERTDETFNVREYIK